MEDLGASSAAFAKGLAQVGDGQALERKRLRILGSINVKPSIIPAAQGRFVTSVDQRVKLCCRG